MADKFAKIGVDDIVESAATGVFRAVEARKVKVEGLDMKDLVSSGFKIEFIIRAGGWLDPDVFGPNGPIGGGGLPGR